MADATVIAFWTARTSAAAGGIDREVAAGLESAAARVVWVAAPRTSVAAGVQVGAVGANVAADVRGRRGLFALHGRGGSPPAS